MALFSRATLASALASLAVPAAAQDVKPVMGAETPRAAADPFAAIPAARPEDVKSINSIVLALYDVISGDAGKTRDWNRFRSLFYPGARMIPTGANAKTGKVGARIATPEDYIKANQAFLEGEGFYEQELTRRVDEFGTVAHVFSAYEARNKLTDAKPFMRGVNSIQLLNDGQRWWVMTVAWSPETAANPLPDRLAKKVGR